MIKSVHFNLLISLNMKSFWYSLRNCVDLCSSMNKEYTLFTSSILIYKRKSFSTCTKNNITYCIMESWKSMHTSVLFLFRLTREAVVISWMAYRKDVSRAMRVSTVNASSAISQSSSSHLIFKISFNSLSSYGLVATISIRSNRSIGIPWGLV